MRWTFPARPRTGVAANTCVNPLGNQLCPMANMLLVLLLIVLILAVAGPLFLVNALAGALKIVLWIFLILLVIGLVGAFLGGARSAGRVH